MDVSITRGSLGFIKKIVEFSTGIVDTQKYFSEGEGGGRGGSHENCDPSAYKKP